MEDHFLKVRVIYRDPPDLVELEAVVDYRGWIARSTVYASPHDFVDHCRQLLEWARAPSNPITVEAGADTGIGWLKLDFFTIDRAGHAACAVTLANGYHSRDSRPTETWRMAIEILTELGLIENFARACITLATEMDGEAMLIGLPC